jgi:hypothetical protein
MRRAHRSFSDLAAQSYGRRIPLVMTDDELLEYLGLPDGPTERAYVANLAPRARAAYERMKVIEEDIKLWQAGVGPKPTDAILCMEHKHD